MKTYNTRGITLLQGWEDLRIGDGLIAALVTCLYSKKKIENLNPPGRY